MSDEKKPFPYVTIIFNHFFHARIMKIIFFFFLRWQVGWKIEKQLGFFIDGWKMKNLTDLIGVSAINSGGRVFWAPEKFLKKVV